VKALANSGTLGWVRRASFVVVGLGSLGLALAVLAGAVRHYTEVRIQAEASALEEQMLAQRRSALEHQVTALLGSLEALSRGGGDPAELQTQAKLMLSGVRYGENGYLFVYDREGTCLVNSGAPEVVGRTMQGDRYRIVAPHLATARQGGGFRRYRWPKPGSQEKMDKISYVSLFKPWEWTVGTGDYLEDIERASRDLRQRETSKVRADLWRVGAIAAGAVCVAFAGAFALYRTERRRAEQLLIVMNQRGVELQEEERGRIARELHDGVSQQVVGARYELEAARGLFQSGEAHAAQQFEVGLSALSGALREIREISHQIQPPDLDLGLASAVRMFTDRFQRRTGIGVQVETSGDFGSLCPARAIALYRIVQEALTNVEKHAGASQVEVHLAQSGDNVNLRVTDNGCGVSTAGLARASGIGLRNIRQRTGHLGGVCRIQSRPGETSIHVSLPLGTQDSV
jgi:two-component system, NarL family, sensor kinase